MGPVCARQRLGAGAGGWVASCRCTGAGRIKPESHCEWDSWGLWWGGGHSWLHAGFSLPSGAWGGQQGLSWLPAEEQSIWQGLWEGDALAGAGSMVGCLMGRVCTRARMCSSVSSFSCAQPPVSLL